MVIKITTRNQKRTIIISRSGPGGVIFNLIFNLRYVELFYKDKTSHRQLENSSRQLKIQERRLLDMFLLQRKCGNCLHRPPPEALAEGQLVLGGHEQCQGQGRCFGKTHINILILAQSLWSCFSFLYGQIFLYSLLNQLHFIWPII